MSSTRPMPKNLSHARFTHTRAVSGCSPLDQPLREAEPVVRRALGQWREHGGQRALHLVAGLVVLAALEDERVARLRQLLHDHRVGEFTALVLHRPSSPQRPRLLLSRAGCSPFSRKNFASSARCFGVRFAGSSAERGADAVGHLRPVELHGRRRQRGGAEAEAADVVIAKLGAMDEPHGERRALRHGQRLADKHRLAREALRRVVAVHRPADSFFGAFAAALAFAFRRLRLIAHDEADLPALLLVVRLGARERRHQRIAHAGRGDLRFERAEHEVARCSRDRGFGSAAWRRAATSSSNPVRVPGSSFVSIS